jgi:hypothetical protein
MLDVAISLLAVIAGGVTMELFVAARPSLGYQNDRSFPFTPPIPDTIEESSGNPS